MNTEATDTSAVDERETPIPAHFRLRITQMHHSWESITPMIDLLLSEEATRRILAFAAAITVEYNLKTAPEAESA